MSRFIHTSCLSASIVAVALLAGCVPTPLNDFPREPNRVLPESYGDSVGDSSAPDESIAAQNWSEFFADPELSALIETALANNQELNIRVQEVLIAENEVMARVGEYLPRAGVGVGTGVEKVGEFTSQGASDIAAGLPDPLHDYRLGFTASWEVDIWSKLRNSAKSATLRYLASVEGRDFMVTQLVAETARSYYELMALDRQVAVLKRNIELQQDALRVVRLEKQAARVTELAVQRFEAEVLKNRSHQYDLEQEIVEIENRINFLVGRFPQPIARNPEKWDDPLPDAIAAGLPSQLLENRPDVMRAEFELAATNLDVEVAKASFYPSLSIEGGVGYESYSSGELFSSDSTFFGFAAGLTAPLLNRRAIKAEYFSANAEQARAVLGYEQTVLMAFAEVANQLSLIGNLERSYELEAQQVQLLDQAIEVSNTLFQSARADYMEVLLTRRDALEAQMELIETRGRQKQAMVNVYQALGGGWR